MPYVLRRDMLRVRDSNGEYIELDTMKGDTGATGAKGETGETGATPHFTVGTVSTGEPGTPASVSITGTDENPVLNMSIPKGDTGETGQKGETGETGATPHFTIGTVTTGLPGTDASAEITGTDEEPVLNMTIPRGNPGEVTEEELSVVEEGLSHKADSIRDETTGDIVSINSELTATLEEASFEFHPVQDLHGQEYPYPGGGGKNKFPFVVGGTSNGVTATVGEDGSVTFNGTASSNAIFYTDDFEVKAGTYIITCGKDLSDSSVACYLKNISGSASEGATLTFSEDKTIKGVVQVYSGQTVTNKTIYPMLRLTSETDSTYVPYSNICPISGYDSLNAYRTGKNLLAKPFAYRPVPSRLSDCFFIKAGTYTFSFDTIGSATSWRFGIAMFDSDGNALSANEYRPNPNTNFVDSVKIWWLGSNASVKTFSLTYLVDCYTRIWFGSGDTTDQMIATGAQLELDSTASTYEQYNGQSVTYQLGQTVYDGVLTINEYGSGQIVSTHRKVTYTRNTGSWTWYGSYNQASVSGYISDYPAKYEQSEVHHLCDTLKPVPNNRRNINKGNYSAAVGNGTGFGFSTSNESLADFLTWLDDNPITVVYELAEPIIVPLSKQEVLSLIEGQNYIWHDANGNTTVIYRVDTKEYVDTKVDEVKTDLTELTETVGEIEGDVSYLQNEVAHKENWIVGNAEQLLSDNYTEDSEPYVFRKSVSGDREFDKIVGGTIAWNQKIMTVNATGSTVYGIVRTDVSTSDYLAVRYTGTSENTTNYTATGSVQGYDPTHVYLYTFGIDLPTNCRISVGGIGSYYIGATNAYTFGVIIPVDTTVDFTVYPQAFDLTLMFGSTVANYIASIENAHRGDGLAFFKSLFPKQYYKYNYGELKSITGLVSHDTVGFNLINYDLPKITASKTTPIDYSKAIRVINNNEYEICVSSIKNATSWRFAIYCYDTDGNRLFTGSDIKAGGSLGANSSGNYYVNAGNGIRKSSSFTPLFDGYVMPFITAGDTTATTTATDTCVHLVLDGKRNGIYEPYKKRSYPLDSSLTLRGIPKLADNKMYFDGDIYESDGTVTRRYGIVDLGTLNFAYDPELAYFATSSISDRKVGSLNIFTERYVTGTQTGQLYIQDKMITSASSTAQLVIRDSAYTDAASFKTAMSGVYLVYELATPTTETAEPFQSPQICSEYGTEEYVYDSEAFPVPVGHVTKYPDNLRKKLDGLPWDLSMMAPIETGTTASQAYAMGQYFLLNNQFCKAKTSIASGATFTLNTNYEVTTLADELFTSFNS